LNKRFRVTAFRSRRKILAKIYEIHPFNGSFREEVGPQRRAVYHHGAEGKRRTIVVRRHLGTMVLMEEFLGMIVPPFPIVFAVVLGDVLILHI
jgi:hypothetical protein